MPGLYIDGIEDLYFRANPAYRITFLDQLSENQREIFKELAQEPDFYGLLIPRCQNGLTVKSLDQNTALLYYTLKRPAILPLYLRNMLGEDLNKTVSKLVFEGILEARINEIFVSGINAFDKLQLEIERNSGEKFNSAIARLSVDALKYAQALDINNIPELAARLYLYNCQPLTQFWKKQFPTPESLDDFLEISPGGNLQALLGEYETGSTKGLQDKYWTIWNRAKVRSENNELIYKLYVSPDYKILRDILPFIFESFVSNKVSCFKLGKDLKGVFRPDKIIAYFEDFNELRITAEQLKLKLTGQPSHGVPFTATITNDGLLSWGVDPPKSERVFDWQQADSWRTWIVKRLAAAIIEAKVSRQTTKIESWQYALESVRLQGIDIQNWLPAGAAGVMNI